MNLNEALQISGIPLEEATITQVIKRVNKHKAMTKSPEELARHLAGDHALRDSLSAIKEATPEEKKQYADLIKDPMIAGAIDNLPTPMRSGFGQLKGIRGPGEEPAEKVKPLVSDAIKQLDPQMRAKLSQMQKEWFSKRTSPEKQSLVATWSKDPVTARVYRFGLKQGVFAMPTAA